MDMEKKMSERKFHITALALLSGFFILCYILPLGLRDMMRPDEFRYGEIPREMIASGNWTTPLLVGARYFEKPALGYQWSALSMKCFGENAFAVRLPSALAVGITMLMIYQLCVGKNRNRWLAPLASMIYLSFAMVLGVGGFAVLDSQLTMALSWCIGAYFLACQAQKTTSAVFYLLLAGLAAGAAFLFKGFLAFAVPVAVIVPFLIWQKDWKKFFTTPWLPLVMAVALALPWSIAIWKEEPDFWNYFFIEEHVKRFTSGTYDRDPEPFWFFVPILLGGMLPGGLLLLTAWRGVKKSFLSDELVRFCLCWSVMPFLLFSASSCKTGTYILPCFPPLAILIAGALLAAMDNAQEKTEKFLKIFCSVWAWLLIVLSTLSVVFLGVWRVKLVETLPIFDPLDPLPLIAAAVAAVCGSALLLHSKRNILLQLALALAAFGLITFWSAPAVLSDSTNPDKMPEKTLRKLCQAAEIMPGDVVVVDRAAAAAVAWVLHRTDLIVLGRIGEFNYAFTKYPDEYKGRYYPANKLTELLEDTGARRVFYIICRDTKKAAYPSDWPIKRSFSEQGVTVAEFEK